MSLTRTLTLLISATVLVIAALAAIWSYVESNHELEELFDAELAQSSRIVQGLVRHLVETQSPEQLAYTLTETLQLPDGAALEGDYDEILPNGAGHKYEKKLAFEVWSASGAPLLDTLMADDDLPLRPGYSWAESEGFRWRTFTLQDPETGFWIRTGQREDIRQELSQELAMGNVLPLLIALPLLAIAISFTIRLGFRPLRRLENPVRDMAPQNIHPLDDQNAPPEVRALVQAVNGLLERLDQALDRERRFSADAAHELRTPLSALRLNLERACESDPEKFTDLIQAVDRMVHLVEQMLLLSRIDAGVGFRSEYRDLSTIVAQSIADVAPLALEKSIEPVFNDSVGAAFVPCHEALINTLMRSLLANAIQYSPSGTLLETRLAISGCGYRIDVCDQGPGIAAEEQERALGRFSRLDQRIGSGSGLGLAIARRIAELHGGELTLKAREDGGAGLCVRLWLPLGKAEGVQLSG